MSGDPIFTWQLLRGYVDRTLLKASRQCVINSNLVSNKLPFRSIRFFILLAGLPSLDLFFFFFFLWHFPAQ